MKTLIENTYRQLDQALLPAITEWVVQQALSIQQVPAPTFFEKQRATHVFDQMKQLGLQDLDIDEKNNVYGRYRDEDSQQPAVMIIAHTDTVFPMGTDLTTRRENGIIYGPGLGDNSIGVAGMLGIAEWFRTQSMKLPCDLWFVATSREEGLGDLGGIRAAFERLQSRVKCVINIEGLAFGHLYYAGIAVRRLHITAHAEGGHSWLHFGNQSAIHGLIELCSKIIAITPPTSPRSTYNIGIIEGGQSVNSIAAQASIWLDLRSEKQDTLNTLEQQVQACIQACTRPALRFEVEIVGDRPAGQISVEHPLIQGAMQALRQVGERGVLEVGSTDGNIPLSKGVPTVTVGVTRGGNAHRLDEYVELEPVSAGMQQIVTLVLAAAHTQFTS
jgi:tripeptide aminopeptidase